MSDEKVTATEGLERSTAKQQKRRKIFKVVGIVFVVLIIGAISMRVRARNERISSKQAYSTSTLEVQDANDSQPSRPETLDLKSYINDDGSINKDKVSNALQNVPERARARAIEGITEQINAAEKNDEMTNAQANALKSAFGAYGNE
jgi:hypothetical protein